MEILQKLSDTTGMPVKSLLQNSLIAGVVLVMLGVGESYIVNILGVVYPCLQSFLALDSEGKDDDIQWLTYWVCFGFFNIID
jgi:receptor expression-enhancing protein 5/6